MALGIGLQDIPGRQGYLAVADGTITARVGTTLGSGMVFLTTIAGTAVTVLTDTANVLNFSSTTGGIPTGTYVWVEEDDNTAIFVSSSFIAISIISLCVT